MANLTQEDEIVYLIEKRSHNEKREDVFEMVPISKKEYINNLQLDDNHVECKKNGKDWGIESGSWDIITDTATYELWRENSFRDRRPLDFLFKFSIGSKKLGCRLADAPHIISFLIANFAEFFDFNKPR